MGGTGNFSTTLAGVLCHLRIVCAAIGVSSGIVSVILMRKGQVVYPEPKRPYSYGSICGAVISLIDGDLFIIMLLLAPRHVGILGHFKGISSTDSRT